MPVFEGVAGRLHQIASAADDYKRLSGYFGGDLMRDVDCCAGAAARRDVDGDVIGHRQRPLAQDRVDTRPASTSRCSSTPNDSHRGSTSREPRAPTAVAVVAVAPTAEADPSRPGCCCLPSRGSYSSPSCCPNRGSIAGLGTSDTSVREQAPLARPPWPTRGQTRQYHRPPARPYRRAARAFLA
jgi:hypothetical protein